MHLLGVVQVIEEMGNAYAPPRKLHIGIAAHHLAPCSLPPDPRPNLLQRWIRVLKPPTVATQKPLPNPNSWSGVPAPPLSKPDLAVAAPVTVAFPKAQISKILGGCAGGGHEPATFVGAGGIMVCLETGPGSTGIFEKPAWDQKWAEGIGTPWGSGGGGGIQDMGGG